VNLPARDKMIAPRYQDIPPDRIPDVTLADGVRVRVIAGEAGGARGPVEGIATQPLYLDVRMEPGAHLSQDLPAGHAAFVYVYEGRATFGVDDGRRDVAAGELAVLSDGARLAVATAREPGRFLVLAARPLREPIARYGPFVMNTRAEIEQAVQDYQQGRFLS
jgi:quercetin 2,3-dioxygenase